MIQEKKRVTKNWNEEEKYKNELNWMKLRLERARYRR